MQELGKMIEGVIREYRESDEPFSSALLNLQHALDSHLPVNRPLRDQEIADIVQAYIDFYQAGLQKDEVFESYPGEGYEFIAIHAKDSARGADVGLILDQLYQGERPSSEQEYGAPMEETWEKPKERDDWDPKWGIDPRIG